MTLRIERTETLRVVASDPEAAAMTPLHEAVAVVLDAAVAGDSQAQAMIDALDDYNNPKRGRFVLRVQADGNTYFLTETDGASRPELMRFTDGYATAEVERTTIEALMPLV